MPTIACPGCGKQYKVPANAAGQVAKCACGKRFRLGAARESISAASRPAKPKTALPADPNPAQSAASDDGDSFWDEALSEPTVATRPAAEPATTIGNLSSMATTPERTEQQTQDGKKKKPKAKRRIRWGFDWGKVAGGGMTFLIAGGITIGLVLSTGYLYFWPAGIAVVGFFTMLSGLMGEDGIW